VKFNFAPIYSTDEVRHFMAVDCEKDVVKKENWTCTKTPIRTVHYKRDNTWVTIIGDGISDAQGVNFFNTLSTIEELPVLTGRNLVTKNIEFIYLHEGEDEDKTLSAEFFDKEKGSGIAYFSSKINEKPRIMHVTELTYSCIDQDHNRVDSNFPCDYQKDP
jgi:hypothetical protein